MASRGRDKRGRYVKKCLNMHKREQSNVFTDHNYGRAHMCDGPPCNSDDCPFFNNITFGKHVDRTGWREGRRIMELDVLLSNLRSCKMCNLGPVSLTENNIVGELQRGLRGYLYVACLNVDCRYINIVPYGKTHRQQGSKGIPSFVVKTKLGTAMIDSLGGPDKVNNFLSTLNMKPINHKNLKVMERRAGKHIESVAANSTQQAATESFNMEMQDAKEEETKEAEALMGQQISDGISVHPDASPSLKLLLSTHPVVEGSSSDEDIAVDESFVQTSPINQTKELTSFDTPENLPETVATVLRVPDAPNRPVHKPIARCSKRLKLDSRFPCRKRTGMSLAVDTAWHKRGFDSLTSHTFFMSKSKYGKKVVKTVVSHRTCATCKWWKKHRPFQKANKECGLSPGKHTLEYAEKQYKRRVLNQKKAQLPSTKRHRLIRKQEQAVSQCAKEALEGQTYESGIGHEQEPDIEQLPEAVPRGDFKPIKLTTGQEPTPVMFDLETTDLIRGQQMPHITQIAAVEPRSGAVFNSYVKPKVRVSDSAEQVTGIVVTSSGMTVHGKPVSSVNLTEAVEKFMKWLEQYKIPILVAHNGRRFDCPYVSTDEHWVCR